MASALQRITYVRNANAKTWVTPEALNVTSDLLGVALARPSRRAMAICVDGIVIVLLSSTGTFWLPAAMAGLVFQMRRRHAQHAPMSIWIWLVLAALVFVAGWHITDYVEGRQHLPSKAAAFLDDDDDDVTAAALPSDLEAKVPRAASGAAALASDAALRQHEVRMARHVAALEAEVAELRKPQVVRWRDQAVKAAHSVGLGFGWAVAYFTLLPFWWKGQTLGKRLLGLRVVELTGKPMSLLSCFGRYGGYAAGMATGGVGFAQALWDPNRQAIQDKIAHTVVVDLRAPRRELASERPEALIASESVAPSGASSPAD